MNNMGWNGGHSLWTQVLLALCQILGVYCADVTNNTLMLMVSFDGFRWDYLDMVKQAGFETPNFNQLIANGVTLKPGGMKNAFPTKTFPNHHSLATGMYPSNHGVVHNLFYDPVYNEVLNVTDANQTQINETKWWNNGTDEAHPGDRKVPEPIWIANQRGQSDLLVSNARRSGVMMWPSGGVRTYGTESFHWVLFNNNITNFTRIDNLMDWFTDEEYPINLGMLYFNEPDHIGHSVGPKSTVIFEMIAGLDKVLGHLIDKLKKANLFSRMNLIVTSDHGMGEIPDEDHRIILADHVNTSLYKVYGSSPVLLIWPNENKTEEIYQSLKVVKNMNIYKKDEIPEEYIYTYNRRIPPLLLVANETYTFCLKDVSSCHNISGNHGYNNSLSSMHPIFIAHGPAFKTNYVADQFNNIDIYPMMCHLLGVKPGPHDGSLSNIQHILKNTPSGSQGNSSYIFVILFLVLGLPVVIVAAVYTVKACKDRRAKYRKLDPSITFAGTKNALGEGDNLLSSDEELP